MVLRRRSVRLRVSEPTQTDLLDRLEGGIQEFKRRILELDVKSQRITLHRYPSEMRSRVHDLKKKCDRLEKKLAISRRLPDRGFRRIQIGLRRTWREFERTIDRAYGAYYGPNAR